MWEYKYPITSDELYHSGTKGMKWGRRLYQHKDGSLTALGRLRYGKKGSKSNTTEESIEERRSRILKSTDPKELYKNRDILTTNEIKERIDRIDTERRLANIAENTKKTGFDRVDKILKIGKKINEVYEFRNTPAGKALLKKMGLKTEPERMSLKDIYDKRNSLSDKALSDALNRSNTEKAIKKILDEANQTTNTAKNLREVYDNRNGLSDKELADALKRATTEKAIKKLLDEMEEKKDK